MFSRKTRKLSIAFLILVIAILFDFCIINNFQITNVNANETEISQLSYVLARRYQVYKEITSEVFPALPTQAEVCVEDSLTGGCAPIGQFAEITWATNGQETQADGELAYVYKLSSVKMPNGYKWAGNSDSFEIWVYIIEIDTRPTVTNLNDCTVNVPQNQEYTLPETLKGTVAGENELVDVAVKWTEVADTSQKGTKVYTATAVNSLNYKAPLKADGTPITAKLTLTVESPTKHYYEKGQTFNSMEIDEYTFLGWAKADNASLGVLKAGAEVPSEGYYFAILAKLEYLGISFRLNVDYPGVRYGFVLKFYDLSNDPNSQNSLTTANLTAFDIKVTQLTFNLIRSDGKKAEVKYDDKTLVSEYSDEYLGYVSNLVILGIPTEECSNSIKVDATFTISVGNDTYTSTVEGRADVIGSKALEAYNKGDLGDDLAVAKALANKYGANIA